MPSKDSSQARADIDKIFQDVLVVMRKVIDQYRELLMQYSDDKMSATVDGFCDKMEVLKHTIENNSISLTERIECVGYVDNLIADLLHDKGVAEEVNSNVISREFNQFKTRLVTLIKFLKNPDAGISAHKQFEEAASSLNDQQPTNEKYFLRKKSELDNIMAQHPDLK